MKNQRLEAFINEWQKTLFWRTFLIWRTVCEAHDYKLVHVIHRDEFEDFRWDTLMSVLELVNHNRDLDVDPIGAEDFMAWWKQLMDVASPASSDLGTADKPAS